MAENIETTTTTIAVTSTAPAEAITTVTTTSSATAPVATSRPNLTPEEVYRRVAPSIPFIELPTGTGSGVLIADGYVVTNYHVVWPYDAAWVVFADGTEHYAPVVGWDPISDIAVLGPIEAPHLHPLELTDGENMTPGSEVFLVGYPAETDLYPDTSITRGILSRFREWELPGLTFLQTDSAIAGGQSGGALVDSRGRVVGISTYLFSEAGFALSTSTADVAPIVDWLISQEGEPAAYVGRPAPVEGAFAFDIQMSNHWDNRSFVFEADVGSTHRLSVDGPGDASFLVIDPYGGIILDVDDFHSGEESGEFEVYDDGIHILFVRSHTYSPSDYRIESTIGLRPWNDPDDGVTLSLDETILGGIDHPDDIDWYTIDLDAGDAVWMSTDSMGVNTRLTIDSYEANVDPVSYDENWGDDLFSINESVFYQAERAGTYFIVVGVGYDFVGPSGYYLTVERATG